MLLIAATVFCMSSLCQADARFTDIAASTYFPTVREFPASSYPYITGATMRAACDHILDPLCPLDATKVKSGDTIFVVVNFLDYFFEVYHPQLPPYILVTHHFYGTSDDDLPGKFGGYLDDQKLIGWFTHNIDREHPKLHPLPIGIGDTSELSCNKSGLCEKYKHRAQKKNSSKNLLYLCCTMDAHPERKIVYDLFKNKSFCSTFTMRKPIELYFLDLLKHTFVLSPRGNGLDCFRTWEALLMGSYPIVRTSHLDPLFKDLPVVIIDDWSVITPEFLEKKQKELSSRNDYAWQKLYMPYWLAQIGALQDQLRADRSCSHNA